ncbi:MAG: hypothetical protein SGARI_003328 [Bacillariaceae sp.]
MAVPTHEQVRERLNLMAESYGLRLEHGFCTPGSPVKATLQRFDPASWDTVGNKMPYVYLQKQIKNSKTFVINAFDRNGDQELPRELTTR